MLKYAKANMPAQKFDFREAIQATFDAHETLFIEEKITLKIDIPISIELEGNKVFFQDVITNLISNSIKATAGLFDKQIHCTAKEEKGKLFIYFYDNGVGIPNDKREWVFGMYNTTTHQQGGAGIGLYIVKTNVETFGGAVEVIDNENSNGTTIRITIPFKKY